MSAGSTAYLAIARFAIVAGAGILNGDVGIPCRIDGRGSNAILNRLFVDFGTGNETDLLAALRRARRLLSAASMTLPLPRNVF